MATYIQWKDCYSVGDTAMDAEHRQIINNVNELYEAMQGPYDAAVTRQILDRMANYVRNHFDHEEKLLSDANYPDLAFQKAQHDHMRRKVMSLRENLSLVTARDILVFLKDWWVEHIQQEDKKYAAYVVKQHTY